MTKLHCFTLSTPNKLVKHTKNLYSHKIIQILSKKEKKEAVVFQEQPKCFLQVSALNMKDFSVYFVTMYMEFH